MSHKKKGGTEFINYSVPLFSLLFSSLTATRENRSIYFIIKYPIIR